MRGAAEAGRLRVGRSGSPSFVTPVMWCTCQPKMLQRSALAFGRQVAAADIETDYALQVEVICNGDETRVLRVHYYVADRHGNLVDGGLRNSNWEEFHEIQPRDRRGGYEVALRILGRNWRDER